LDGTLAICDAQNGENICTLQRELGPVYSVALNPVGNALASAHHHGTVKVWDIERAQAGKGTPLTLTINAHKDHVFGVAYSADGRLLASAGGRDQECNLGIWDAVTGHPIHILLISPGILRSVAFSPEGRFLACATGKWVHVVDVEAGRERFKKEMENRIFRLVYSPDGQWLAAACEPQTIRLLDPVSGEEVHTLQISGGELWGIAFSANGRYLASCSGYKGRGTIQIWDASLWDKQSVVRGSR
jgi:WD40 repeat protein